MGAILRAVGYDDAFPELAAVYLEDSWVLEVAPSGEGVAIRLEAVLTPEHPLYRHPAPHEQHCYRAGWLTVTGNAIDVQLSGRNPSLDPDGSADYGSIDTFRTVADGFWEMEGDWGSVKVNQPVVRLQLD